MAQIRVLDSVARCMQRLGYLKYLARRVVTLETANLDILGHDLVNTVTAKARVPLTAALADYVRSRLTDRAYTALKRQVAEWDGTKTLISMEIQDLYLSDPDIPSSTGKLVIADWRRYPPLGTALGLIRPGTYSPNTRALSLLYLTSADDLRAFAEHHPPANPLCLTTKQAMLLLYSLLENDGEIVAPLLADSELVGAASFTDREVGDRLPALYKSVVQRHLARPVSAEVRDRLNALVRTAGSISNQVGQSYAGGSAREEASRVRVEPYADLRLLVKPDVSRYVYSFGPQGRSWATALDGVSSSEQIGVFLNRRFFAAAAEALGLPVELLNEPGKVVTHLYPAWQAIKSQSGYAPIEEVALVAGITALCDLGLVIELAVARDALIAYQRAHPYKVRFSVDRKGALAHVQFLEEPFSSDAG